MNLFNAGLREPGPEMPAQGLNFNTPPKRLLSGLRGLVSIGLSQAPAFTRGVADASARGGTCRGGFVPFPLAARRARQIPIVPSRGKTVVRQTHRTAARTRLG